MSDSDRTLTFPLAEHGGHAFPADVDIEPTADRYVGHYENVHGEQLVYVHDRGEQPGLYHGDYGWNPVPARWPQTRSFPGQAIAPWTTGDLILEGGEALWLASCLYASGSRFRDPGLGGEDPVQRLMVPLVERMFAQMSDEREQQWSQLDAALGLWRSRQVTVPSGDEDHYAEGAIKVELGMNTRQRKPRQGVDKATRDRIEREAAGIVSEVRRDPPRATS